jgi:hypothetical protein
MQSGIALNGWLILAFESQVNAASAARQEQKEQATLNWCGLKAQRSAAQGKRSAALGESC